MIINKDDVLKTKQVGSIPTMNRPLNIGGVQRVQSTQDTIQKKKQFLCSCGYKFTVDTSKQLKVVCPWCAKALDR